MPKVNIVYLSKSAYAREVGVSEKAIRKAITEGKIKKGWDADKQKVIKHLADKEYGHLHDVAKPRPGISREKLAERLQSEKVVKTRTKKPLKSELGKPDVENFEKSDKVADLRSVLGNLNTDDIAITSDLQYAESIRRKAIIELALEKKKLEELQGVLVRKDDVEKALFAVGSQLKNSLLAIPQRIIEDVLAAPTRVESLNIMHEAMAECLEVYANLESLKIKK